jgi:hypothetical protein
MALAHLYLPQGILVEWLSCYYTETYDGFEGHTPDQEDNQWVLEVAKAKANTLWPDYPIVVQSGPATQSSSGGEFLPPVTAIAFLRGTDGERPDMRSYIVLIYFQHETRFMVDAHTAERLASLDWRNTAFYRPLGL